MTTKKLRLVRSVTLGIISILAIAIYTIVLMNLPEYFDSCRMLKGSAKVLCLFSCTVLAYSILSYREPDDIEPVSPYFIALMLGFYEFVCVIYFIRIRIIGYHHIYAFCDNYGLLVAIVTTISIILLYSIFNEKSRRILYENHSCKKKDDNNLIKGFAAFGLVFSLITIIVVIAVELSIGLMFKPSYEEQGYGFVRLGLDSGTVWADGNLFSTERTDEGASLRWTSHQGDSTSTLNQFVGDRMSDLIIPTESDWYELLTECKALPSYYNGVYGITIVGKNRVKRMFLPAPDSDLYSPTIYWTATPSAPYVDYYEQWYEVENEDEDEEEDENEDIEEGNDSSFSESEESVTEVSEECLEETIPDDMCTVNLYTIEYLPWGVVRNDVSKNYLRGYVRLIKR